MAATSGKGGGTGISGSGLTSSQYSRASSSAGQRSPARF
jgi:hypothetical protein